MGMVFLLPAYGSWTGWSMDQRVTTLSWRVEDTSLLQFASPALLKP
jgi:hypothetical protein